jgi:MFS family permease
MSTLHLVRREDRLAPALATPRVRWLTIDVILVLVVASTWGFAFSTFYLLPAFLVQELAAGPAEIGFVVGIAGISTVVFTLLAAAWIDALPRRHAMALGALAMSIAALGFTRVHALGWAIDVLRVLQGISYALVVTSVGTLIAELVPHERLSQALGLSGASMLVMNALAPAVAEPLAATVGWRTVFLLAAAAALASAVLARRIREPATPHPTGLATIVRRGGLLVLLRRPLARQYALILALSGAAFGTVFTFQQPFALALGRARVGGFFVAYAAAAILVRVAFGHVPDRFGRHRVALAALLLYAGVVLGMAGMRPGMLELLGAIFGLAHGVFYPAINALALIASAPHERGRIVAIFTASFSLGLWAGPTVLGVVAARFGYPAAFVAAACGTLGAAGILQRSREMRAAGALRSGAPAARRPDARARRDAS